MCYLTVTGESDLAALHDPLPPSSEVGDGHIQLSKEKTPRKRAKGRLRGDFAKTSISEKNSKKLQKKDSWNPLLKLMMGIWI